MNDKEENKNREKRTKENVYCIQQGYDDVKQQVEETFLSHDEERARFMRKTLSTVDIRARHLFAFDCTRVLCMWNICE